MASYHEYLRTVARVVTSGTDRLFRRGVNIKGGDRVAMPDHGAGLVLARYDKHPYYLTMRTDEVLVRVGRDTWLWVRLDDPRPDGAEDHLNLHKSRIRVLGSGEEI